MANNGWILHVDCKEPNANDLAEELRSFHLQTKVSNLAVADYWFEKDGKVWCAVERKKLDDFCSSIKDGRYKDQSSRLLKSDIPHMWFLVVGSIEKLDGPDKITLNSAMMHLQMHRNLKVAYVDHEGYIKPFFVKMHHYLCDDPSTERITAPLFEHIQSTCRKRKLENHSDVYTAQLMCINGVSEVKASSIARVYPDFMTLMRAYQSLTEEKDKVIMLRDLQAGKKKLGVILSERIYRTVMNRPADSLSERVTKRKGEVKL